MKCSAASFCNCWTRSSARWITAVSSNMEAKSEIRLPAVPAVRSSGYDFWRFTTFIAAFAGPLVCEGGNFGISCSACQQ